MAAVAGHLVPRDIVPLDQLQQRLPEIAVLNRLLLRVAPAVGAPAEIPLVAEAGGAGERCRRRAQLLEARGRDGHAAAAAEAGLDDLHDGEPAARAEQLVVVGQHGGGELSSQLLALGADAGQLGLDAAQLFLERAFVLLALGLAALQPRLGVLDLAGRRSWLSMRT